MSTMPAPALVRKTIAPGAESTIPPKSMPFSDPVSLHRRQPLFGRDDVLAALEASAAASFDAAYPGLFTLIGDSGLGKTRLAAEAAGVVDRLRPGLLVFFHRAAQPLADAAGQTTRELLARVLGASSGEAPSDARAFCRLRLGDELGEEVWPAVALALGWSVPEAVSVTPGALQRGTMLALTEGLRRLSKEGPVVLLLDDAHWADDTALDALEYATLNAEGCPLWVMVTAHPRFENVRRTWGSRAQRHDRVVLGQLDEEPAMRLAAELLLPAEYPPAATLKRLSEWAGFNPACLAELARTLKRAGIVRQRPNLGTWYVATAELDRLPPSPAWQWLAVRQLDALQPELASCVRLCSVFGVEFSRAEVERVQDAMERAGIAGTTIDMGVGLSALVEKRVLLRGAGDRYLFQSSTFQDAVYKLLDAGHREKIHRHAFEYWRSRLLAAAKGRAPETTVGEGALAAIERGFTRLARHAGACGEREQAADAYLTLGDSARARHKHVEADQYYTAALGYVEEGDTKRRGRALAGRGKVRYRLHRIREALEDLKAARELSEALGDDVLRADLLLEESTAFDFAEDFAESAIRAEQARPLIEGLGDRHLELRLLAALGRSGYRHGRTNEAAELLARAADGGKELNDYETRVIAILLLAPVLISLGHLDEAEARFEEVLALCTSAEDWLHLGAAYANRAILWIARKRLEQTTEDLRRAIQLAREVGNPRSESIATYNVAEFLHWLGDEEEAVVLARRVRVLEERFTDRPNVVSSLLLARIQASRGDFDEVRRLIEWITESCPPDASDPVVEAFFAMLQLVLLDMGGAPRASDPPSIRWDEVTMKAGGGSFTEELLEVLYWRAKMAIRCERWEEADSSLKEAQQRLDECPMWRLRFADLMSRSLLRQPTSIPVDSRTVS
ncbi:MAG TPA: AAA family ATPase [Polyangiaceae bacterium]|nr:AAA family ATPase [Polyangiaceae bacterium]